MVSQNGLFSTGTMLEAMVRLEKNTEPGVRKCGCIQALTKTLDLSVKMALMILPSRSHRAFEQLK